MAKVESESAETQYSFLPLHNTSEKVIVIILKKV